MAVVKYADTSALYAHQYLDFGLNHEETMCCQIKEQSLRRICSLAFPWQQNLNFYSIDDDIPLDLEKSVLLRLPTLIPFILLGFQ